MDILKPVKSLISGVRKKMQEIKDMDEMVREATTLM